jgi:chromosome segregation ATPase
MFDAELHPRELTDELRKHERRLAATEEQLAKTKKRRRWRGRLEEAENRLAAIERLVAGIEEQVTAHSSGRAHIASTVLKLEGEITKLKRQHQNGPDRNVDAENEAEARCRGYPNFISMVHEMIDEESIEHG